MVARGCRESHRPALARPVRSQAAREEVGDGWDPSPQARGKTGPWCKMAGGSWLMGYRVLVLQDENFSQSMAALQCEYKPRMCTAHPNGELYVVYLTITEMKTTLSLSKKDFLGTLSYPGEPDPCSHRSHFNSNAKQSDGSGVISSLCQNSLLGHLV